MARRETKKVRGIYEQPAGSGIWWINYYAEGKRHREKVGARGAAIDLYRTRKTDALRGAKLPDLRRGKATLSALIDDVLEYAAVHNEPSNRDYVCKAGIVRAVFGDQAAAGIKPQDIDRWLTEYCKTAATANRYKAFFSLCYREGMRNGKVEVNPARMVRHRKEPTGRLRFLSKEEYGRLHDVITQRFPEHLAEFVVSVHSGMRLTEQYTCTWAQVDLERGTIELTKTKNWSARTVHLNSDAVAAIQSVRPAKPRPSDRVFPRETTTARFDNRSWFQPCLKEAAISGCLWHTNRHTFCSWLAMAGASIKEIQEAAGHKTITMSARYAHLSPEHTSSVVERISSSTAQDQAGENESTNSHQNSHQRKKASRK